MNPIRPNRLTSTSRLLLASILLWVLVLPACADDEDEQIALDIGHLFLMNLEYAKWNMAYKKLSPRMQQRCGGSANAMAQHAIDAFEARITRWENTSYKYEDDWARASFEVERDGMALIGFGVSVENHDGQWLIEEVGVGAKDLCP